MGITRFDQVEIGLSSVTGAALAATSKTQHTILTTESLTTAAGASSVYTINNKLIKTGSVIIANIVGGSFSQGTPVITATKVTGAGVATINIGNVDSANALNGTLIISIIVLNSTEK